MSDELADEDFWAWCNTALGSELAPSRRIALEAWRECRRRAVKTICEWMIDHGYATGHGDSVEDLLHELEWQIKERIEAR